MRQPKIAKNITVSRFWISRSFNVINVGTL